MDQCFPRRKDVKEVDKTINNSIVVYSDDSQGVAVNVFNSILDRTVGHSGMFTSVLAQVDMPNENVIVWLNYQTTLKVTSTHE